MQEHELNDAALDAVTGGTGDPMPSATGGITYQCSCGTTINASTRDVKVVCPNVRCRREYKVSQGKLYPV